MAPLTVDAGGSVLKELDCGAHNFEFGKISAL